jgi:3-dehydroquinate synthase
MVNLQAFDANIVLAGFMGTGKSTVGRLVAARLGRPFVDTDQLVEAQAGMPVKKIFEVRGEAEFRILERMACLRVSALRGHVVALGGGALLDPANTAALEAGGVLVLLTCEVDTLAQRLKESALRGERPLLSGDFDFRERIAHLLDARRPVYDSVRLKVDTTHLNPEQVARQVITLYAAEARTQLAQTAGLHRPLTLAVRSPDGQYPVVIGRGLLDRLGPLAREQALGATVVVATDNHVAHLYADRVLASLREARFRAGLAVMPAGEAHKCWASVDLLIEAFMDAGMDRSGWVLALGGGVVGDTAGFAASIFMRGVPLVQVPTTLLAMADSSLGGKVGVDHRRGKNLLGAFKQPRMVVADPDTLSTLRPEHISQGMAEIIKAAIIGDPALFRCLEGADRSHFDYGQAVIGAVLVKRGIVERDPYESGERALLNLGHTFGHAFEACTHYARPHGYAVAQGMAVATRLARLLGMCEADFEQRLARTLERWNLPVRWGHPGLTGEDAIDRVWQAMSTDKKRRDGQLRLVLPEAAGRVRVVAGVPEESIRQALAELQ